MFWLSSLDILHSILNIYIRLLIYEMFFIIDYKRGTEATNINHWYQIASIDAKKIHDSYILAASNQYLSFFSVLGKECQET